MKFKVGDKVKLTDNVHLWCNNGVVKLQKGYKTQIIGINSDNNPFSIIIKDYPDSRIYIDCIEKIQIDVNKNVMKVRKALKKIGVIHVEKW